MTTKFGRMGLGIGVLAAVMVAAAPAYSQGHSMGGGGGHGSSGGHSSFGGHAGHSSGGGYGHAAHAYNYGGAGRGTAGVQHFAPGARGGYGGYGGGYAGHGGYGGYGGYGGGYGHWHGSGAYWGGGWWRGGYWPRAWYGLGFSWFLPVLPLAYATYWWDGLPYYYANDVYYTWNPAYEGYVATDPPPVTESEGGAIDASVAPTPPPGTAPGAGGQMAGGQIFMYPRNGQSEAQQATDRAECQQWAGSQAGGGRPDEFRRAMTACAEARGYSAK